MPYAVTTSFDGSTAGMTRLNYPYPFSGWHGLDLSNCVASLYMYLEGIHGSDDYDCKAKRGERCDGCGNCGASLSKQHERMYFLFDTAIGRTAAVIGWENKPTAIFREIYNTDDSLDFLMGYVGYGYVKHTDSSTFADEIRASVDGGVPVLARIGGAADKLCNNAPPNGVKGAFRVIVGYADDRPLVAETVQDKDRDETDLTLADIDSLYVVTGRAERRYTLLDVLKRIRRVMESDRENGEWDKYIHAFSEYWDGSLGFAPDYDEIKQRFRYLHMGMVWNCHCLSHCDLWIGQVESRCSLALGRLFAATHDSHLRQWQAEALWAARDWSQRFYYEVEHAMCESAADILRRMKYDDEAIYNAVCEMIGILEG
jgi:hypothetical protein